MEQSLNNKTQLKERFISFLKKNKIKVIILSTAIFIFFVIFFILKEFQKEIIPPSLKNILEQIFL